MPNYRFQALSSEGGTVSGTLAADNREAALAMVLQKGLRPVRLESTGETSRPSVGGRRGGFRAGQRNVEIFMRQTSNLLKAGVSLSRALEIVSREAARPDIREQWRAVREDVVGGVSFADALARRSNSFPEVYTSMVRAGETGGFLDLVLGQIADFCERDREIRNRVRTALIYPVILLVVAGLVMLFLMFYFIPQFSDIFQDFGGSLPLLTRAVVASSNRLMTYGLPAAAFLVLAGLAARRTMSGETRLHFEKTLLRLPLLGPLAAEIARARFCRMLGTLLKAGVPLVTALNVSKGSLGYRSMSDGVGGVVEKVRDGSGLSRGLASAGSGFFPPAMVEIVGVAEESGSLDQELVRLADNSEKELDQRLRVMVAVFEPALLFLMAIAVGLIVVGMLLPIFSLQDFIS